MLMCSEDFENQYLICIVITKSETSNNKKNISIEILLNI